jgi:hypothetical protein
VPWVPRSLTPAFAPREARRRQSSKIADCLRPTRS